MVMQRWDPFRGLRRIDTPANRFWRGFGVGDELAGGVLPVDVVQEDDDVVVRASLPGVKPEDIEVTIEEGRLTIKAEGKAEHEEGHGSYLIRERRAGRFHRALRLPDSLETDKAETRYEDGVLTITFPKMESRKAKRLEIKAT